MKKIIIALTSVIIIFGCSEEKKLDFQNECELVQAFFKEVKSHNEEDYSQIFDDFFVKNELQSDTGYLRLYTNQFDHYKTLDISDYACLKLDSSQTVLEYGNTDRKIKFKLKRIDGLVKIESCITMSKGQEETWWI